MMNTFSIGKWLFGSWMLAATTWAANAHLLLSIVATIGAIIASIVTILLNIEARRARRAEANKAEIDATVSALRLCRRCMAGEPPQHCPIPCNERPVDCPLRKNQ